MRVRIKDNDPQIPTNRRRVRCCCSRGLCHIHPADSTVPVGEEEVEEMRITYKLWYFIKGGPVHMSKHDFYDLEDVIKLATEAMKKHDRLEKVQIIQVTESVDVLPFVYEPPKLHQ